MVRPIAGNQHGLLVFQDNQTARGDPFAGDKDSVGTLGGNRGYSYLTDDLPGKVESLALCACDGFFTIIYR